MVHARAMRMMFLLLAHSFLSSAGAGTINPECLDVPSQCDCLSHFGFDPLKGVDREDVKQGYKSFAKYAHPDKHYGDGTRWEQILMFGNACKEFLRGDSLDTYTSRIKALLAFSKKRGWTAEQLRERIEELHVEFGIGGPVAGATGTDEPMKPRFSKRESPTEKMHIFLDNSVSFQCGLEEAATFLEDIFPRLERTPTSVHLMSFREDTKQLFSETDDFVMDDITKYWTAKESLDLLFMMDVTGSMSAAISSAKDKVMEIGEELRHRFGTVRIGFLGYRDFCDGDGQFVEHKFTTDWASLKSWIQRSVAAEGGGDGPENVIGALERASQLFSWVSQRRLLVHTLDAPGHPPRDGQLSADHWLRRLAHNSIEYAFLQIGGGSTETTTEYKPLFDAASPVKPMMVMQVSECTPDSFQGAVMDAAFEATPHAKGTFMWEYIFEQLKARRGRDQEVVILTDGHDNASGPGFLGTEGFNRMMQLLKELGMALPRITVFCFCNAECTKGRYKELAMASGGEFFSSSDPGAKAAFKAHMLLSHAERIAKSRSQQQKYEQITADGTRFDWYMPLVVSSGASRPSGAAWGLTCQEVDGAQVCTRKSSGKGQ